MDFLPLQNEYLNHEGGFAYYIMETTSTPHLSQGIYHLSFTHSFYYLLDMIPTASNASMECDSERHNFKKQCERGT